jgi:drug/metabolite transporter (DMT)-like permease
MGADDAAVGAEGRASGGFEGSSEGLEVVNLVDDVLLGETRSKAIESMFLDDFVEDCALDDAECKQRQATTREELWAKWRDANQGVSKRTRGLVLFGLIMAGFGANITLVKVAQQGMSTDLFAELRFAVASLVFAPFLKNALKDERIVRGGLELGLWVALGYYLQNVGLESTDAARASFISSFNIIIIPMIAGLAGRTVKNQTWIATAVAVAGLAVMENVVPLPGLTETVVATSSSMDPMDAIEAVEDTLRGDLFTLGSATVFAVHIFRTDCIFNGVQLKHKESMGLVCLQMLTVVVAFAGLLAKDYFQCNCDWNEILGVGGIADIPWDQVFLVGAVTTAGCVYLETVALTLLASQDATLMMATEPVWGGIFAYLLLGETLSSQAMGGAALILLSTIIGSLENEDSSSSTDDSMPSSSGAAR